MSKEELLVEFQKLSTEEREAFREAIWTLEEREVLSHSGPTPEEMALLDRETAEYEKNPNDGEPWEIVLARLRSKS